MIRDARHKLGLTQAELALEIGVSRRWVIQVEQAKTSADLRLVLRALKALGSEMIIRPRRTISKASEEPGVLASDGRVRV